MQWNLFETIAAAEIWLMPSIDSVGDHFGK
jgi:hypothetical protein